ncbi:MAG: hypothetical protein ABJA02_15675, partial [Acidobacteriota bacterium]
GRRQNISVTPEISKGNGFVFQTNDENGMMPATPMPGRVKVFGQTEPTAPAAPAVPTAIMAMPGRVL